MLGASLGLMLEDKFIRFEIRKGIRKKILRVGLGIALVLGLRLMLKGFFPESGFFDCLRYFAMMFAASFLYPMFFKKFGF